MIYAENNLFLLKNDTLSYLFRINAYGQPEHLHFGAPVQPEDAEAFALRPGLGWGGSVLLQEGDTASCADDKGLEWSGSGRGDYRESPLEIDCASTELRYGGHRVIEGPAAMTSGLPQAQGGEETLELTLEQPGLCVKLYYTLFPTALTRRTVIENADFSCSPLSSIPNAVARTSICLSKSSVIPRPSLSRNV